MVLVIGYSSSLTSFLTVEIEQEPLNTIMDLVYRYDGPVGGYGNSDGYKTSSNIHYR